MEKCLENPKLNFMSVPFRTSVKLLSSTKLTGQLSPHNPLTVYQMFTVLNVGHTVEKNLVGTHVVHFFRLSLKSGLVLLEDTQVGLPWISESLNEPHLRTILSPLYTNVTRLLWTNLKPSHNALQHLLVPNLNCGQTHLGTIVFYTDSTCDSDTNVGPDSFIKTSVHEICLVCRNLHVFSPAFSSGHTQNIWAGTFVQMSTAGRWVSASCLQHLQLRLQSVWNILGDVSLNLNANPHSSFWISCPSYLKIQRSGCSFQGIILLIFVY